VPNPEEQPVVMDMQFYANVAKMTVMWCASSFGAYLLNFLNKYLEGTIFENNYVEASAGIIALLIGSQTYALLGKRFTFLMSYTVCFLSGILVYLLEADLLVLP
jgi:hypothetical protein